MKVHWQDDDFKRLTLKIHGLDIDVLSTYPILTEYGFNTFKDLPINETTKYIVYAFDRNSPPTFHSRRNREEYRLLCLLGSPVQRVVTSIKK